MKIVFEAGDFVIVEDSMQAGRAANCTLKLISKKGDTWTGVVVEGFDEVQDGDTITVKEQFIHPAF